MRQFHILLVVVSLVGISPSRSHPVREKIPTHGDEVDSLESGQTVHPCVHPCDNEAESRIQRSDQKYHQYIEISTDDKGKRQFKIPTGESPGIQFVELRTGQQATVKRGCGKKHFEDDCKNEVGGSESGVPSSPQPKAETQDDEEYEEAVDEQVSVSGSADEELGSGDERAMEIPMMERESLDMGPAQREKAVEEKGKQGIVDSVKDERARRDEDVDQTEKEVRDVDGEKEEGRIKVDKIVKTPRDKIKSLDEGKKDTETDYKDRGREKTSNSANHTTDESSIAKRGTFHGERKNLGSNSDGDGSNKIYFEDSDWNGTEDMAEVKRKSPSKVRNGSEPEADIVESQGDQIVRSELKDVENAESVYEAGDEEEENPKISEFSYSEDDDSNSATGDEARKSSVVVRQSLEDDAKETNFRYRKFQVTGAEELVTNNDTTEGSALAKREGSGTNSGDDGAADDDGEAGVGEEESSNEENSSWKSGSKDDADDDGESRQLARARRELVDEEHKDETETDKPATSEEVIESMKKQSLFPLAVFGN